jgi:CubicO group peptidase (beta-lactamase class C family)
VLGLLLARATGQQLGEVMRTRIFEPLGMRDTAFWTSQPDRLATAYRPTPDGLTVLDEPGGAWSRPPAFEDGAAGLVSMTTDQLTPAQKSHGGLGADFFRGQSWSVGQLVHDSGAFGWNGGLGTSWLTDPAKELTMIVSCQRWFDSPDLPRGHRDIQAAAYAALA